MFGEEFQAETTFCPLIGSDLQVFDANGDRYDDLTCHTSNGTVTISETHIVEQRTGGVNGVRGHIFTDLKDVKFEPTIYIC